MLTVGLALRHGWGVAKDDRKAFAELRQACDESLAEGGLDFHQSPGAVKLTLHQKRALTVSWLISDPAGTGSRTARPVVGHVRDCKLLPGRRRGEEGTGRGVVISSLRGQLG